MLLVFISPSSLHRKGLRKDVESKKLYIFIILLRKSLPYLVDVPLIGLQPVVHLLEVHLYSVDGTPVNRVRIDSRNRIRIVLEINGVRKRKHYITRSRRSTYS